MLYKREFPNFQGELKMLDGFEDSSWHNNACPSISLQLGEDENGTEYAIKVWQDWQSEISEPYCDGGSRYLVCGPVQGEVIRATDSWEDVIALDLAKTFEFWCP